MRLTALLLDGDSVGRAARKRRHHLEHDIECLMTSTERQDLVAALGRYPDSMTGEVREMLDHELTRERFDHRFGHLHTSVISDPR